MLQKKERRGGKHKMATKCTVRKDSECGRLRLCVHLRSCRVVSCRVASDLGASARLAASTESDMKNGIQLSGAVSAYFARAAV